MKPKDVGLTFHQRELALLHAHVGDRWQDRRSPGYVVEIVEWRFTQPYLSAGHLRVKYPSRKTLDITPYTFCCKYTPCTLADAQDCEYREG